jgi:hypothetical protein
MPFAFASRLLEDGDTEQSNLVSNDENAAIEDNNLQADHVDDQNEYSTTKKTDFYLLPVLISISALSVLDQNSESLGSNLFASS